MSLTQGTRRALLRRSGLLPFYDPFNRANGGLVAPWQSGGATWTIAGNEAVNTPTEGGELLTNGDFTAWTGDDPDGWTVSAEDVNNYVTENPAGEAQFVSPIVGQTALRITQAAIATVGNWYAVDVDMTARAAGFASIRMDTQVAEYSAVAAYEAVWRATGTDFSIWRRSGSDNDWTIDDVSVKLLTLNTLFSSVETGTADVVCQVELDTVVVSTQAGLVLNLDDKDAPANFVIAYHDGTDCVLEKCVAGTYTSVITAATAYAAGATIQVVKRGTSYSLYYNSAQVSATQTVSDAGIVSNTLHGMFSTYSGNQLDNFQCVKA